MEFQNGESHFVYEQFIFSVNIPTKSLTYSIYLFTCLSLSHLVFRAFPESLDIIAKSVESYLHQNLTDDTITLMPFTTAVVAVYLDQKKIQPHCDQQWSATGEFKESQNSQVEGTATVVLVIGAGRGLDFEIYGHYGKKQVKIGIKGRFQLQHGSLFVLDPRDEEPVYRNNIEEHGYTFYKHSSDGVEGRKLEMSIGIVFRTTNHLVEVYRDTGLVVLDKDSLEMNMFRIDKEMKATKIVKKPKSKRDVKKELMMFAQRNTMLEMYMKGEVHRLNKRAAKHQRITVETHFRDLWEKCKKEYLPILSVAKKSYITDMCEYDVDGRGKGGRKRRTAVSGHERQDIVCDHEGNDRKRKRKRNNRFN